MCFSEGLGPCCLCHDSEMVGAISEDLVSTSVGKQGTQSLQHKQNFHLATKTSLISLTNINLWVLASKF